MWIQLEDPQLDLLETALEYAERHNREGAADLRALVKAKRADFDAADPYRAAAKEDADDDLEIDDDAIVSPGDDPGAWVHAWVWIPERKAGLFTCDECSGVFTVDRCAYDDTCDECAAQEDAEGTCRTCGEEYEPFGDGYDGECPSCADKTDQKLNPENYE